jgi:uncharacterized OB-fold protein
MSAPIERIEDFPSRSATLAQSFTELAAQRLLCFPRGCRSRIVYPLERHLASVPEQVEWVRASGRARLHSFARYHQQYARDLAVPYDVANVELEEGPRLIAGLLADNPARLCVGLSVCAEFSATGQLIFRADFANGNRSSNGSGPTV